MWSSSLDSDDEWDDDGLGKLGSRHLRVVSPIWRLKDTIDEILDPSLSPAIQEIAGLVCHQQRPFR